MDNPPSRAESPSDGARPEQSSRNQSENTQFRARPVDSEDLGVRYAEDQISRISSSSRRFNPHASVFVPSPGGARMTMSDARPRGSSSGTSETVSLANQQRLAGQQHDRRQSLGVHTQQSTRPRPSLSQIVHPDQNFVVPRQLSRQAFRPERTRETRLGYGFGAAGTRLNMFPSPTGHGAPSRSGVPAALPPQLTSAFARGTYQNPFLLANSNLSGPHRQSIRSIPTTRAAQGPHPIFTTAPATDLRNFEQRRNVFSNVLDMDQANLDQMQRQVQDWMTGQSRAYLATQPPPPAVGHGTQHSQQFNDAVRRMSGASQGNPRPASAARERLSGAIEHGVQVPRAQPAAHGDVGRSETRRQPFRSHQASEQQVHQTEFIPIEVSRGLFNRLVTDPNLHSETHSGQNVSRPEEISERPRSPIPVAEGVEELQIGLEVRRQQYEEKLREAMSIKMELQELRTSLEGLADIPERHALYASITSSLSRAEDDCRQWREKVQQIDTDIELLQTTIPRTPRGYRAAGLPPVRSIRNLRMFSSPVLGQIARGGAVRVRGPIPSFSPTVEDNAEDIEALTRSIAQLDARVSSLRRGRAVSAAVPESAAGYHSRSWHPTAADNGAMGMLGQFLNMTGNAVDPEGGIPPLQRSSGSGPRNAPSHAASFSFDDGV